MTAKDRKAIMSRMTYVELTEVITNGNRALKQIGILKAERNEIRKNQAAALLAQSKYKDVDNSASGNFN